MNKKIYFNDRFIEFVPKFIQISFNQQFKNLDILDTSEKQLEKIMKLFLNDNLNYIISYHTSNFDEIFITLKKMFYYIEAAGGFIEKESQFLFIHRHGKWDLPKGKLEKNETIEVAAIRECEEECSIENLIIKRQLSSTFHIYQYKTGYALKQSYWFYMHSDSNKKLVPQLEEGIDEVKWFSKSEIKKIILKNTYFTIQDVVEQAMIL